MARPWTDGKLRRARVHNQRLAGLPGRTVAETVEAVVGIQAQDEGAAALSIRARSRGLLAGDVDVARTVDRSIVLTWTLRGTRHYHHRADVRWLVALLGPVFSRPNRRTAQLGIAGQVGERAARVVRDALASDGPLTRRELAERLARTGVDARGQAPIHVIRRAALEGVVCVVPGLDGGKERYALLDDWVPPGPPVPEQQAAGFLVRRYLAAYGPARPSDFSAWSGLSAATARRAWSAIASELSEVDTGRGRSWVLTDRPPADTTRRAPLRLVGGFDTFLLGYADRAVHVHPDHWRRVNAGGGMVRPVVIADGQVVGTWAYRRRATSPRVEVVPFRPFSAAERTGLEGEATDVGRFLGSDPALTVALP